MLPKQTDQLQTAVKICTSFFFFLPIHRINDLLSKNVDDISGKQNPHSIWDDPEPEKIAPTVVANVLKVGKVFIEPYDGQPPRKTGLLNSLTIEDCLGQGRNARSKANEYSDSNISTLCPDFISRSPGLCFPNPPHFGTSIFREYSQIKKICRSL